MTPPSASTPPFVSGWRAGALNLVSGSLVVAALSSALVGVGGADVAQPPAGAAGTRVQLGPAPVLVAWPVASTTAYVDLDLSGARGVPAVLEGLQRASAVEACSAAWTRAGTCPGRQLRLQVGPDGRLAGDLLDAPLAHLKVSSAAGRAHGPLLVLRTAAPA